MVEQKQSGLTLALSGTAGSAINSAVSTANDASKESSGRLAALQGMKAALTGVQAAQAASLADAGGATGSMAGVNLSYGSQSSRSEQTSTQTQSQGSSLTAGNSLTVNATGTDLNVQGSLHLKANQSHLATLAYFPLLADGLENSGLLIEQIIAWQQALSATPLTGNLPCLLGLYSRLSQQRHSHDPERATWTGRLTTSGAGHLNLETCLIKLLAELDAVDDGSDLYAIQRQALGSMFVAWMAENRIMNVLQSLFDNSQLDLAGVTLADHSEGFSRHGAWSQWMQEKYGILPALSASTAMPPLPAIPLPAQRDIQPFTAPLALTASGKRRRHWPAIAALLFMLCAAFTFHEYRQAARTPLSDLNPLRSFLPAPQRDKDPQSFVLTDVFPLFKHGSSSMMPGSETRLEGIATTLMQHPHQMFLIVGHTDSTGSPRANYALSRERAQMVKDWLVTKTGLPTTHFVVEGAGNMHPIASNETEEGRAQNRRVEIISLPVTSKRN